MKIYSESKFGQTARRLLLLGAEEVYQAVAPTLGARGRNMVLWKQYQTKSINDGVKTAQRINPQDPFRNAGAEILKQAGQKQMDIVGDGTTASIILGYAIATEAEKLISSGVNPMALRSALEKGRDILIKEIKKISVPLSTKNQKYQIATIASQSKELGDLIGNMLDKAGVDGVITVEQAVGPDTFIEHEEGVQINSGYRTEYFITNPISMTATISKAKILVTDYKLNNIYDLVPLFGELFNKRGEKNFVIIANEIEGNVLATLLQNKIKGMLNVLAIKAPSYQQQHILKDLSIVLGAKFISNEAVPDLKIVTPEDLGYAESVTSSKDATVFVGGGGEKKAITDRILSIKTQIDEETNEFNKQKLRERLAKLSGGIYVVRVGGQTEVEIEDKKERIDDAIQATRAAMKEGIIPGGEIVYLSAIKALKPENENEEYAFRILSRALLLPFSRLMENSGFDAGEMRQKIEDKPPDYGVDVTTGKIVDMFNSGIIDPTLVATEAIRNGVSVASMIILSDGIIVEKEEEVKK